VETSKYFSLEKYSNDGWGLSFAAFKALQKAIDTLPEINVIEFGSGFSSQFLIDYAEFTQKKLNIDSFDNDKKFKHPNATLVKLLTCSNKNYEAMFNNAEIDWDLFRRRWRKPKTRQKNCFYDLRDYPLKPSYNLAIIDGPHGNGRNFAYLILKDRMQEGFIMIDDFNHYDFVETASSLFDLEEITRVVLPRDNFVFMKASNKKRSELP